MTRAKAAADGGSDLREDRAVCAGCGKPRPHTILRLNRVGRPRLCDGCAAKGTRAFDIRPANG